VGEALREAQVIDLHSDEAQPVILPLPANDLRGWTFAEPFLLRALQHTDEWGIDDVREQFCCGKVGLILCLDSMRTPFGALCVEIQDYPKKRILQVHLFGANDHSEEAWMGHIWPQLQELARSSGCSSIMGTGRDGWVRKLHAKHRYLWEVGLYPDQET
jgi:hypothetical protein